MPCHLKQITRLASTTKLSSILEPTILNIGTPSQVSIPRLIYSTAWKGEKTNILVYQAIKMGYRGIETGAEPLKYEEKLVGDGIRKAINEGFVERKDLYIQTTFTSPEGQGFHSVQKNERGDGILENVMKKMPYSVSAPISQQIHDSIASSLQNLKASRSEKDPYIDCVVFLSPHSTREEYKKSWDILSIYVPHPIRSLGVARRSGTKGIGGDDSISDRIPGNKKSIVPSVYMNRYINHREKDIGFGLRHHSERDMVFQSFWEKDSMTNIVTNPLMLEVRSILKELGYQEENSGKLGKYALLLAMRLREFAILDTSTNIRKMEYIMQALKALERWRKGEDRETCGAGEELKKRWERVEIEAKMYFQFNELQCKEESVWVDERRRQDGDLNVVAESALDSANIYSPIRSIWPPTSSLQGSEDVAIVKSKSRDMLRWTQGGHELDGQTTLQDTDEQEHGVKKIEDTDAEYLRVDKNKARHRRHMSERKDLLHQGYSPSFIVEKIKEQRLQGKEARLKIRLKKLNRGRK
ncbi:hypothetical protein SBOR_0996 [Sclerotinia borealis F-4128]|uniref:NADP-dependent oxidoreductase domain-containing protein n=1 Tax=Sclerotinia borealis (strain F-4128) TaxID=1432307 RepID=W9CRY0_SCLBF|nr:hypothetical protein SBOR_0996 [Sclerotinia borealis F-4128]